MSAVIQLIRLTGALPAQTSEFGLVTRTDGIDAPHDQTDTTDPVPLPTGPITRSYWGVYRLYCSSPPATLVTNFRLYSTGVNAYGPFIDGIGIQGSAYTQATGSGGVGLEMSTMNIPSLFGSGVLLQDLTLASPWSLTGSASAVGWIGDYIYLQVLVLAGASPGPTGQQSLYIAWDET